MTYEEMAQGPCECVILNRREGEQEREWFKRIFCMYHWMQTDYYRNKLNKHRENWGMSPTEEVDDADDGKR